MTRRIALLGLAAAAALCAWPEGATARVNPITYLSNQLVRPDIIFSMDNSGSMHWQMNGAIAGSDCSGQEGSGGCTSGEGCLDICGDYICSGHETVASCPNDCALEAISASGGNLYNSDVAGGTEKCYTTNTVSRMFVAKRAMQNVLPELRSVASVGLIGFRQDNYFIYSPATATSTKTKGIYLSEWELRASGSWTQGLGWDDSGSNDNPQSFTVNSIPYTLSGGVAGDSLYRREDTSGYVYQRINWAGKRYYDGTYDWDYLGSYFTYTAHSHGTGNHMPSQYMGPEYVDSGSGTHYVHNRYGPSYTAYGIWTYTAGQVFVPLPAGTTQDDYDASLARTLQFFNHEDNGGFHAYHGTPIYASINKAREHYAARAPGDPQSACRPRFVIQFSDGDFSLSPAQTATVNLYNLDTGNPIKTYSIALPGMCNANPTCVTGADCGSGICTDGVCGCSQASHCPPPGAPPVWPYNDTCRILPGDTTGFCVCSRLTNMDQIADCGDDGNCNNDSSFAYLSNNERDLVNNIRAAVYDAISGQYTTSAAGVATSGSGLHLGDLAVIPAVEFPGWRGQLRQIDLKLPDTDPGYEQWDAGELLRLRTWSTRNIYSGSHSTGAFRLFDAAGNVDTTSLTTLWNSVCTVQGCTTPSPAMIEAFVKWLAGEGRPWKLPPIINAVPVTVGAPPQLPGVAGHDTLEAAQQGRTKLYYVPSNEGLLHAFEIETGNEAFAYLAPHALDKAYQLFRQGGQKDDPTAFEYILANSPRAQDFNVPGLGWGTYLIQNDGPGGDDFFVLDITAPSGSPPVTVVFTSYLASAMKSKFGETWSVPVMFWDGSTSPGVAMGSGYNTSTGTGQYYNYFPASLMGNPWTVTGWTGYNQHAPAGAKVDYGLITDAVGVYTDDTSQAILATYQANLNGEIVRYTGGDSGTATTLSPLTAGPSQPFHLPPAALRRETDNRVTLAFASGSYQENQITVNTSSPYDLRFPDATTFLAKLYVRTENDGAILVGVDEYTSTVDDVCNAAHYSAMGPCTAPSIRAQPVGQPVIIEQAAAGNTIDIYFLLYDPPAATCSGSTVDVGDSYLVHITSDGGSIELKKVVKKDNVQASGLTIVGGGSEVVMTEVGHGAGTKAKAETTSGNPVGAASLTAPAQTENWRIVR